MHRPHIEVVCIGTELLTGHTDSHTAYLGLKLGEIGLRIARSQVVGDDPLVMRQTFAEIFKRSDLIISCGGLGPTFDDLTRNVWAKVLKRPLFTDRSILRGIKKKFKDRNLRMPPANRLQAQVIQGAEVLENGAGTAPGQFLVHANKILILLPGPPRELIPMFEQAINRFQEIHADNYFRLKSYHLVGVPESAIDEKIRLWVGKNKIIAGCKITHGILASNSVITVKFIIEGKNRDRVEQALAQLDRDVRRMIGPLLFGEDRDTLEGVVGRLLTNRRSTLAVAESCTGGLVSKLITDRPGSSDYFREGVTVYHNQSKIARLGVRKTTLKKFGAVSEPVAREMAQGLRKKAGVDYALSVTGIAGPGGASPAKPVGLVYIGCTGPRRSVVKKFQFSGDRAWIRHRAALMALDILRQELLKN